MRIQTGRNPFARETITKRQVDGNCDWCGGQNGRGKVYVYMVDVDSIRPNKNDIKGQFCGIGCLNSYHT
jgi:hypothetical protein